MTTERKRFAALGIAALMLLIFVIALPLRIARAGREGATGMFIIPGSDDVLTVFPDSPAAAAGIREEDRIAAINGIPIKESARIEEQARRLRSGDRVQIALKTREGARGVTLTLRSPFTSPIAQVRLAAAVLVSLVFLATGLFVYLRKPDDKRALLFYLISVTIFATFALSVVEDANNERGLTANLTRRQLAAVVTIFVMASTSTSAILHFALTFPKERPVVRRRRVLLRVLYATVFLLSVGLGIIALWRAPIAALFAYVVLSVWGLACVWAAVKSLYRSYRESGPEEKRQLRWPLWGTIVALVAPNVIGLFFPAVLGIVSKLSTGRTSPFAMSISLVATDIISSLFFLLIPLSFAFAILKHRLMDIDVVIKKTIIYAALTGIVLLSYLVVVGGIGGLLVKSAGIENQIVTIGFTLIVAVLFVPARNRVQGFVDRRFFRQKRDYPQALSLLSHEATTASDLSRFLQTIAETLQKALQNRSVIIFQRESRGRSYVAAAKVGVPDEVVGKLKIDDHAAALKVPVTSKGEVLAIFGLGTKLSDEEFNAEDSEFLSAVADQAALGIENLQLRREEQEYDQAREIQEGLLPREIPQVRGCEIAGLWQPARAVGGDYYDVLKFNEGMVGVCIADVAGKGLPAALLMSNLQATVKAVASPAIAPKELCERVNRAIGSNVTGGRFITFFYGLVDVDSKTLVYANAGHNPPILLHADGSATRLDKGGAVLTRLFRNDRYEQGEVPLRAGDRLVLFTDGVTEARNTDDEEFGEERLLAVLAANARLRATELQNEVLQSVTRFTDGELQDDLTLAIVSIT